MSLKGHDPDRLLRLCAELEADLAQIPPRTPQEGESWIDSHARVNHAVQEMVGRLTARPDARASIRATGGGAAISMLGFRATATSGVEAACRNWIAQVRAKVAAHRRAYGRAS